MSSANKERARARLQEVERLLRDAQGNVAVLRNRSDIQGQQLLNAALKTNVALQREFNDLDAKLKTRSDAQWEALD